MTTSSSTSYLIPVRCRASIRAEVINNVHYMCIRDLIMHFGHHNTEQAFEFWQQVPKDSLYDTWTIRSDGQPMITLTGALKLMPLVPGSTCENVTNLAANIAHYITKAECKKAETVTLIPFAEIVPGATVRLVVIEGTQYLSVRDVIMHVCGKDNNDAGQIWRRMSPARLEELRSNCCLNFQFPGRGQSEQHVITFPGALKLIMFLPGEVAKKHYSAMVSILARYFTGDASLLQEIEANVVSESPIHQAETTALIPFDEIVPGASVRLAVINGVQYLSVRDVIMHVCGKNNDEAGLVWRRMSPARLEELRSNCCLNFQFPGRGQSEQPVITFQGALKLIMFLPGEVAKKHRSAMVSILTRYFAGDASLLKEIEANAASESPIQQMAREALKDPETIEDAKKRKYDEIETEIHSLNRESQVTIIDKYNAMCDRQMAIIDRYSSLCPANEIDDRAKQVFKQMLLWSAGIH